MEILFNPELIESVVCNDKIFYSNYRIIPATEEQLITFCGVIIKRIPASEAFCERFDLKTGKFTYDNDQKIGIPDFDNLLVRVYLKPSVSIFEKGKDNCKSKYYFETYAEAKSFFLKVKEACSHLSHVSYKEVSEL